MNYKYSCSLETPNVDYPIVIASCSNLDQFFEGFKSYMKCSSKSGATSDTSTGNTSNNPGMPAAGGTGGGATPMPVVIVAGEEVSVPEQGIIRAVTADLSVDIPVA